MDKKDNKKVYIEILRIVAIFFVIFNHTSGFYLFAKQELGSAQFWVYSFISVFCKVSVPLFLMLSGGLLLGKDEAISAVWRKRILKIFLSLLVISIFYYIHNGIIYKMPMNFSDFIKKFYTGTVNGHLWYMYLFLGYLISVPLLRKLVQSMDTKHFIYMIVISVVFLCVLPTVDYLAWDKKYTINSNIKVSWVAVNMVLYPCMGYFVENKLDMSKTKKFIPLIWLINIGCIVLSCYMTYKNITDNGTKNTQAYLSTFVSINAMTLHITAKGLLENVRWNNKLSKTLCSVGGCTYGIYLFHIAVKDRPFMKDFTNLMIDNDWNFMITYFVFTLAVLLITYVGVWILRKIPGIKYLL